MSDESKNTSEMTEHKFARWMENLPDRLCKVPLGHLAIPGSHNSFSSSLETEHGVAVDQSDSMRKFGDICCGVGRKIIHRWAVTQSLTLVEQLTAGIRYFDLRVCRKPETGQFHFLHGLYGSDVKSSLEEIIPFFKDHPKEVIILDMNHFFHMDPGDHDVLLWQLGDVLGDLLVPVNGYQYKLWNLTLNSVWNHTGRIILIYHNPFNAALFPNIWNKNVILSPWPNTPRKDKLLRFLETCYSEKQRPAGYGFHVWQGCVTPRTSTVVKHIVGSLKTSVAKSTTEAYVNWVKEKAPGEFKINICLVDFVEMSDFIPTVIGLNSITMETKEDIYVSYEESNDAEN